VLCDFILYIKQHPKILLRFTHFVRKTIFEMKHFKPVLLASPTSTRLVMPSIPYELMPLMAQTDLLYDFILYIKVKFIKR
tara:strand:- start:393 stop:632 length:240 start_codon:yes stop_codon:yes gene_type:complete